MLLHTFLSYVRVVKQKSYSNTAPTLHSTVVVFVFVFFVFVFFFNRFIFFCFACFYSCVIPNVLAKRFFTSEREWVCVCWRGGVGEGWKEVYRLLSALHEVRASHFLLVYSLLFHSTLFSILFSILTSFLFYYFLFFPIISYYIFAGFDFIEFIRSIDE